MDNKVSSSRVPEDRTATDKLERNHDTNKVG